MVAGWESAALQSGRPKNATLPTLGRFRGRRKFARVASRLASAVGRSSRTVVAGWPVLLFLIVPGGKLCHLGAPGKAWLSVSFKIWPAGSSDSRPDEL